MRQFTDEEGRPWVAEVTERPGRDFKGRFSFVARRENAEGGPPVELEDLRWNSERTARRTLETMSEVELRRRLRSAIGRAAAGTVLPSG